MQKAAFNSLALYALARSGLVAGAVRSEAVIAVGDAGRHRNRLRPLFFDCADLLAQGLLSLQLGGRQDAVDLTAADAGRANDLVSEQRFAWGPLIFRNGDGALYVRGKFLVFLLREL